MSDMAIRQRAFRDLSPEEQAKWERELAALGEVLNAIRGRRGIRGEMVCPACGEGTLRYRTSASNGHVGACCSTPGCLRFVQ
jgi:hypothetical protein